LQKARAHGGSCRKSAEQRLRLSTARVLFQSFSRRQRIRAADFLLSESRRRFSAISALSVHNLN